MVTTQRLAEEPKELKEDFNSDQSDYDDVSDTSSNNGGLEVCPSEETAGNFGNIVVKNSSEVHFGNKTFYQGPVTIRQFLYNNTPSDTKLCIGNGLENPALVTDSVSDLENIQNGVNNCVSNGVKNGFTNSTVCSSGNGRNGELSKRYKLFALCVGFTIALTIILFTTLVVTNKLTGSPLLEGSRIDSDEQETVEPVPLPQDPDAPPVLSGKLRIITRGQWVAQPPVKPANKLKTPVPLVIILHTATENCSDQGTCVFRVRLIQSFHIDSFGWWDIGYNFLVGGDGFAYEGRGWTNEGAHTYGFNSRSIGIAFIGTFNDILPPPKQILAAKQLIEMGVRKGYIAKNYKLFAHRQMSSTQSPGHILYEEIKTWPHWASKFDSDTTPATETNSTVVKSTDLHEGNGTSSVV